MLRLFACTLVLTAASQASAVEAMGLRRFSFVDPETKALAARGQQSVEIEGGDVVRKTEYRGRNGALLLVEACRYIDATLALRHFEQESFPSRDRLEITVDGDRATVRRRAGIDGEVETTEVRWDETWVIGPTMSLALSRRWSELAHAEAVDLEFFVPPLMRTFGFRARASRSVSSEPSTTVALEAANWLVRPFAPKFSFTFETSGAPSLVRYEGPSDVTIDGEANKRIEMTFD